VGAREFDRQTIISAVSSEQTKALRVDFDMTVNAGGKGSVYVYARSGYICNVTGILSVLEAPSVQGATAGSYFIYLIKVADNRELETLRVKRAYNHANKISNNIVLNADEALQVQPTTEIAQISQIKGLVFDENNPIEFRFLNNTDATIDMKKLNAFVTAHYVERRIG